MKHILFIVVCICFSCLSACSESDQSKTAEQSPVKQGAQKDIMKFGKTERPNPADYKDRI